MERSSSELLPPDRARQRSTDQIVVGALSRAGRLFAVARGSDRSGPPTIVDAALGSATIAVYAAGGVVQTGWRVSAPLRQLVARPPLVPERYQPATFFDAVVQLGEQYRLLSEPAAEAVVTTLVKQVIDGVLDQIDLTTLVLERVDLDAVIKRLDLTEVVLEGVDLDRIVATVDIGAVIKRLDLTEIVVENVDLDRVVDAVDIDAVIHRLDLVTLTTYVLDEIDLPEIIRQSTGSVASETVRGVRMQSVGADQAVQRAVDRLLLRRKARSTGGAVPPTNGTSSDDA